MYRRPILCTLFILRCWFLKCSEAWLLVGGVLLVHSEIYDVPIGDGWEEVLVRNVSHYVPVLYVMYHIKYQYCY
jgi:hypothetical protein